ncbi:MAG: hypothetical protein ACRDDP_00185, partial [Plesiomonas sp.]
MINQNNPLQPMGAPTADLQLNAYRQRYTQLTSSLNEQVLPAPTATGESNPFADIGKTAGDSQEKKRAQIEQWLAPIDKAQPIRDPSVDARKQKNFEHHFFNDPALKEVAPAMQDMMGQLLGAIQQGQITPDQAHDMAIDWCDENLVDVLDKHHTGTESHHVSMLSDPIK